MNRRIFWVMAAVVFGLFSSALQSAFGLPAALEGTVTDSNWHRINNATVRIEARTGEKFAKTVKTDAKGHYWLENLEAGTYRITLVVDGKVKADITNATARAGESRKLNFDLTGRYGARATHLVFVREQTDSALGGHWVDVNDRGHPNTVSAHNIQTLNRFVTASSDNIGAPPPMHVNPPGYVDLNGPYPK